MAKKARTTWTATWVATVVGVAAWWFGVGEKIWPAHPVLAVFLLTLAVCLAIELGGLRYLENQRF